MNRFLAVFGVSIPRADGEIFVRRAGPLLDFRMGPTVGNFGVVHSALEGKAADLPKNRER
jgi:hypothetical protein